MICQTLKIRRFPRKFLFLTLVDPRPNYILLDMVRTGIFRQGLHRKKVDNRFETQQHVWLGSFVGKLFVEKCFPGRGNTPRPRGSILR